MRTLKLFVLLVVFACALPFGNVWADEALERHAIDTVHRVSERLVLSEKDAEREILSAHAEQKRKSELEPKLDKIRHLKPGQSSFIEQRYISINKDWVAFVADNAPAWPKCERDDLGVKMVKVTILDAKTCRLDLGTSDLKLAIRNSLGWWANPGEDQLIRDVFNYRATAIVAGGQTTSVLPEKHRAIRIFEMEPYSSAYVSCHYAYVDTEKRLWIDGGAPVSRTPFKDDYGLAIEIRVRDKPHFADAWVTEVSHKFTAKFKVLDAWRMVANRERTAKQYGAPVKQVTYIVAVRIFDAKESSIQHQDVKSK